MPPLQALPPVQPAPAPAAARAMASLVRVRVPQEGTTLERVGSGVVIGPGLVATNAHVIGHPAGGVSRIQVLYGTSAWKAAGVWVDPGRDLCLLDVPDLPVPAAPLRPRPPAGGEPVFALGFPGGQGPVLSRGHLRAVWHYHAGLLLQTDAELHPGSSGGGLFDQDGFLLGLTTFTAGRSPRLSFALDSEFLEAMVQGVRSGTWIPRSRPFENEDVLAVVAEDPRNWPAWEPAARQWTEEDPDSPEAWFSLGLALDRRARREADLRLAHQAAEAYHRSLALKPDARAWNNLGVSLDTQNRFPEAERAFGEAIRLRPDYGLAWLNLGITRINAKQYALAAEATRRGLTLLPDQVEGWILLARCLQHLQDWAGQSAALAVALRYRPLSLDLWLDRGLAELGMGHRPAAEGILQQLRALAPDSPQAAQLASALAPRLARPARPVRPSRRR